MGKDRDYYYWEEKERGKDRDYYWEEKERGKDRDYYWEKEREREREQKICLILYVLTAHSLTHLQLTA